MLHVVLPNNKAAAKLCDATSQHSLVRALQRLIPGEITIAELILFGKETLSRPRGIELWDHDSVRNAFSLALERLEKAPQAVPVDTSGDGNTDAMALDISGDGSLDTVVPIPSTILHPAGKFWRTTSSKIRGRSGRSFGGGSNSYIGQATSTSSVCWNTKKDGRLDLHSQQVANQSPKLTIFGKGLFRQGVADYEDQSEKVFITSTSNELPSRFNRYAGEDYFGVNVTRVSGGTSTQLGLETERIGKHVDFNRATQLRSTAAAINQHVCSARSDTKSNNSTPATSICSNQYWSTHSNGAGKEVAYERFVI